MAKKRFAQFRQTLSASGRTQFRTEIDCRACQYRVQRTLKNLAGITSFQVSLRLRQVSVQFDESVITASAIQQTVERAVNRSPFDE